MKKHLLLMMAAGVFLLSFQYLEALDNLSWEDCVREAAQNNPDLHAAQASLRSAEFQKRAAYSGFLPQLSADLNFSRGNTTSPDLGPNPTESAYSASLTATENIFAGLQDRSKIKTGRAKEEGVRASLTGIKAEVSLELKTAFASLLYAQNSLRLTQEIIRRRQDNLNLIQLRYENGRENKGSLLLSKAYLEDARYNALQARNLIRVSQEELAKVLGRDNSSEVRISGRVPTSMPSLESDIHDLAVLTPDYLQAVAEKKSAKAAITSVRAPFFPSLTVSGTTGRLGDNFFPENKRWSVGVGLSWPFFSGGKDYYATKSASEDFRAALAAEESTRRFASTNLQQGWAGFLESIQKLRTDQSYLEAARVREEIARNRYENGLISFDDWDIIENDLITREKQVLQSQRNRVISEAAWEKAQGRGVIP